MKNLRELLREQILTFDGETHDLDFYRLKVKNWPDEDGEPIDMENCRIVEINKDLTQIVIVAGGDWQEGAAITIEAVNGELVAVNSTTKFPEVVDPNEEDIINLLLQ